VTERPVTIVNRKGLHARAAARFVQVASGFASSVRLAVGTIEIDGKSILGLMTLAAVRGTPLRNRCEGPDEAAAADALCALVEGRFGEDE
jgi:phosphocarrier protein